MESERELPFTVPRVTALGCTAETMRGRASPARYALIDPTPAPFSATVSQHLGPGQSYSRPFPVVFVAPTLLSLPDRARRSCLPVLVHAETVFCASPWPFMHRVIEARAMNLRFAPTRSTESCSRTSYRRMARFSQNSPRYVCTLPRVHSAMPVFLFLLCNRDRACDSTAVECGKVNEQFD